MNEKNIEAGLKSLIEQTYLIEQEYKNLNNSYESLQKIVKDVIDVLPTAIWVLNSDMSMFLQNSKAARNANLLSHVDLSVKECELELNGVFYLVKIEDKDDKKIISAIDITTQKRTERLASMGSVAAHLAHEIRNPIGSVSLLTSILLKKSDGKNAQIASEIQKAIWRVERIIKATLLFTKGVQINSEVFNFNELKNECEEALRYYAYSKNIEISIDFGSAFYNGDKDLLAMVFQNMLFNAIDACEESDNEQDNIKIWYEKTDNEHKFNIYDSGVAINNKAVVFEPFKTSKLKGNGLGLALCLQIVEAHKGSIEVSLNPKNFCVSLPIF